LIPFLFPIYGPVHTQLVRIGYRIAIHKANKIIAVSQTTVSDLQKILSVPSEQIAMVYNACAESLFFPRNGIGEMSYLEERYGIVQPYVLTLSAGNWRTKNLDTALAAIELARSHTGMSFQTVVAGPHEGLSASGMKDKVSNLVATGFIESEDLPKLYRNASAFVTVSRYEGFGIPLVEAMACGCPCVTSTGGSLAEVAGNAAPIFGPDDAEGMAGAIAMLLKDSDYRSDLSSRGVRRAAEFSYTRAARETLEVYRDVASRH
jgi:glycosyltransferase involved in cell wall biosynthesis